MEQEQGGGEMVVPAGDKIRYINHINIMCFVMYLNQQSNTYLPRSTKGKGEMISSSDVTMYLHSEGCVLSRHVISVSAGTRLSAAMMRRVEGWRQCVVHRSPASRHTE